MNPNDSYPGAGATDPGDRALLQAVADLVRADREMRRSLATRLHLGEADLRGLRFVMARTRQGTPAQPRDVAAHLQMSTAAATTLLDRLVGAGHLERLPHPTDRRSKVVEPTQHAWEEADRELAALHDRMREVARQVPDDARPALLTFLTELTEVMAAESDAS